MKLGEETIIHPLLMQHIQNHYPSMCNIAHREETRDELGQPIVIYTPDSQLIQIPCAVMPTSGNETRGRTSVVVLNQWTVGLNGYYPSIHVQDQATIDETVYDILRVAFDDQQTATYLTCEIVTNG